MTVRERRALLLLFSLCLALLVWLAASFVADWMHGAARRNRDILAQSRLLQIALALHNYSQLFGSLPPLAIEDAERQPLLSWRVALGATFEDKVFRKIDRTEAWNSPTNTALAQSAVSLTERFRSPNDRGPAGDTSFVALDWSTVESPLTPAAGSRIILIEVHDTGIHWMEPREMTEEAIRSRVLSMLRQGETVHFLMADGGNGSFSGLPVRLQGRPDDFFLRWAIPDAAPPRATIE